MYEDHFYPASHITSIIGSIRTFIYLHDRIELNPDDAQAYMLRGNFYLDIGESGQAMTALRFAEEFLRRAELLDDDVLCAIGHRIFGAASWSTGKFDTARDHLHQALARYDAEKHSGLALTYVLDVRVAALAMLSGIEWYMGKPDRAVEYFKESMHHARALSYVNSTAFALTQGGIVFRALSRDFVSARRNAHELLQMDEEFRLPWWGRFARFHLGWGQFQDGNIDEGIVRMREALGDADAASPTLYWAWHATVLSEVLVNVGNLDQAHRLITEVQTLTERGGERWFEAEICRVRGDIAHSSGTDANAEAHYRGAIAVAREQDSKSLELRAATSLARLWHSQGKTIEARDLLAPVYGWFTEGFDTADLKEAKALLDDL